MLTSPTIPAIGNKNSTIVLCSVYRRIWQNNAAFAYTRAGGNRFNAEGRGAWYCSWEAATSIAEVAFHRTRELGFIGIFEDAARYVELLADFIGEFPDLTGEPGHPALHPDPALGYPEGQALADRLQREGRRGLVYPSVRHTGGRCLVAFDPHAIQNVRPGASYDLVWNGSPHFDVIYRRGPGRAISTAGLR